MNDWLYKRNSDKIASQKLRPKGRRTASVLLRAVGISIDIKLLSSMKIFVVLPTFD